MWPFLMVNGPAKSIPVFVKTELGVTHYGGSWSITCCSVLAVVFLHVTQLRLMFFAPMMCYLSPKRERKGVVPEWRKEIWLDRTRREVNLPRQWRMIRCFCE